MQIMTSKEQEMFPRLPKWAQERIQHLEAYIKVIEQDRADLCAGINAQKESKVWIDSYGTRPKIYLPDNSHVVFKLDVGHRDGGEEVSVRRVFDRHDSCYGINVHMGWNQLAVHPHVTNSIDIVPRGR